MRTPLATLATAALLGISCSCSTCEEPNGGARENPLVQGQEAFHRGQYALAIERYRQALEKHPRRADIHNLLGMAHRFAQEQENEIAAFRQAVELDPAFWIARVNLGASLLQAGRTQEAAEQFRRVLEIRPDHPQAERFRAILQAARPEGDAPSDPTGGD